MSETKLYIEQRHYADEYALYGRIKSNNTVGEIKPVTVEVTQDGLSVKEPFLVLAPDEMQNFFNQLWLHGFRPKDGTGNGGHIEALKYHLEDLRRLVFQPTEQERK